VTITVLTPSVAPSVFMVAVAPSRQPDQRWNWLLSTSSAATGAARSRTAVSATNPNTLHFIGTLLNVESGGTFLLGSFAGRWAGPRGVGWVVTGQTSGRCSHSRW